MPGLDFILRPTVRSPRSISRRRLELAQHPNWAAAPLQLAEGLLTWKDDLKAGPLQVCRLGRGLAKCARPVWMSCRLKAAANA